MTTTIHLTPASALLDGAQQFRRADVPPPALVNGLNASQAIRFPLPVAARSESAGVRSCPSPGASSSTRDLPCATHDSSGPAASPPAALAKPRAAQQGRHESKQNLVLVADDDASIRESLAAVLRSEGYEVQLAENGRVAVRQFLDGPPDIILLDLNMPDTDGWRAFEIMARLAPSVPVIIITARPCQARRAAEAGIDMLLEKPLDIPMLLETVRDLLVAPEKSRFAKVLRAWHTKDLPATQG